MIGPSTRLGLDAPEGTDPVKALPDTLQDWRTKLDSNVARLSDIEPAFSTYKSLRERHGYLAASSAAGTYLLDATGSAGGTAPTAMAVLPGAAAFLDKAFYLDPADFAAGSRTTKYRIRAQCFAGGTAPGITLTVGLYPVATFTHTPGNVPIIGSLGSVVTGSNIAFATPGADSQSQNNSGDFTAPTAGYYVLAALTSGASASGSAVVLSAELQMRQV